MSNARYRVHCKSPVPRDAAFYRRLVQSIYKINARTPAARYVVLEASGQNLVYEYSVPIPASRAESSTPRIALLSTVHFDGTPFDLHSLQRL